MDEILAAPTSSCSRRATEASPSRCSRQCAGLPSIATRVGGIPETVRDGMTGLIVRSDDVEACSRAMKCLAGSADVPEALRRRRAQFQRRVLARHDVAPLRGSVPRWPGGGRSCMSLRILYHHRTQGRGAEGLHIRSIVGAARRRTRGHGPSPPGIDPLAVDADVPVDRARSVQGACSPFGSGSAGTSQARCSRSPRSRATCRPRSA